MTKMEHVNTVPSSPAINFQQINSNQSMHSYQTHVYQNEQAQAQAHSTTTSIQQNTQGTDNLDQNDLGQILKIFQKYNLKVLR